MTIGRLERIAGALLLIALAASCGPKDRPIPAEPKARSEFLSAAATKLTPDERSVLNRFSARLDTQTAAGAAPPEITVPRALEVQRTYETQVTDAQRNFQKLLEAASTTLAIDVRDTTLVKDEKARARRQGASVRDQHQQSRTAHRGATGTASGIPRCFRKVSGCDPRP